MLVAALRAKGWSNRDVGREILAAWKKRERLTKYPKPEAIAVKVGLLVNGDATWWINHEKALAALADLLHCKPDDLLPTGSERRPEQIEFPEFVELAGLLPGQHPCAVNPDGWLGTYVDGALQQGGRWWFVVPPGAGKSLAVRALRQRHGARVVVTTTRTLFEAAREATDGVPLVIEVDYADSASDLAAIGEVTRRTEPTCILAAFERPGSAANDGWKTYKFELHRNWREQLVGWTRSRLPVPDRIDVDAILNWLDEVDPITRVFSTPGDLISILARIYRAGLPERSAGLNTLASEWLSQALGRESDPWLQRLGRDAAEHAVVERVRRLDMALEPLSASTWAHLLPESVLRTSNTPSPPTKRGKRAKPTSEPEPATVASNAREAIHALADKGVLRTTHNGGLDVFPSWVRAGLEREAIQREVRSGNASSWGLWALDASRKDLVDDALDGLGPNELVRAASGIEHEEDLASVAAVEALFSAFGRRFAVSEWRPSGEAIATLQSLGRRQLHFLDRNPQFGAPLPQMPLTRHRPGFEARWQMNCWLEALTFSFAVPKPNATPSDPGWRLPGWAGNLQLREAPQLPYLLANSNESSNENDPWLLGALRVVRFAVRACRDEELPDDLDLLLLPWVVIDGPAREWRIGKKLARGLIGTRVLELVRELLRREADDVCAAAVAEVWRAVVQLDEYANPLYALRMLRDGHRTFFDLLATHLPLDAFEAAFTGVDLLQTADLFTRLLLDLPDRLSRLVIRMIAEQARATNGPIWNLDADIVKAFGHDQLDVLVDLTAERFAIGGAAAKRVWELDQRRSMAEALKALNTGVESASTWFYAAPPEHFPRMLDAAERLGASRPRWMQRWLATVLSRARMQAPRVFAMMTTHADGTTKAVGAGS
jgi:hypothetical protein